MALDSAIAVISRWGSTSDDKSYVFDGNRDEIDQYLQAADEIQCSITGADADDENRAKSAIQIAMLRLADEFRNILKVNSKSTVNPNSTTYSSSMTDSASTSYEVLEDDYVYRNALSETVIADLRSIAGRMNSAGYLEDCKKAYIIERKQSISASYRRINIVKLSGDDAQRKDWNELKSIIGVWITSAKICFRKDFAYEKQLCEKIFEGLGNNTNEACFFETVQDYAIQLLDIAEALSCVGKASERLFEIIELYKTLFVLLPQINKLFDTQSSESLRTKATTQILPKLAAAVREILLGFEAALLTADESQRVPVDQIHSLSKYVMDYVSKLCHHEQTLMTLPLSLPPSTAGAGMSLNLLEFQGPSELPLHVILIIKSLVSKLESKAKQFPDASARHIFLVNNLHYVVQKINGNPQVKEIVGDDYFRELTGKLDQAKAEYLRSTFGKVLHSLRDEGLNNSGILRFRYLKLSERLKDFNAEFKNIQRDHASLVVPDFQLLQDLRASIEVKLVPAYTLFLGHLSSEPRLMNDVMFSADGLKTAILNFFVPAPNSRQRRRS